MGSFYIPPAALSMRGVEHDSSLATNPHWATNKRSVRTVQFGFSVWLKERGGIGDMEIENALERIKTFFQKYAETRFRMLDSCGQLGYAPSSPAGYVWEEDNGERIFLVEPNVFRDELCRGVNRQVLLGKLKEFGWLARNRYGMLMETKWIGGRNKRGVCFVPQRWEEGEIPHSSHYVTKR